LREATTVARTSSPGEIDGSEVVVGVVDIQC
jgi:hypothetical protein